MRNTLGRRVSWELPGCAGPTAGRETRGVSGAAHDHAAPVAKRYLLRMVVDGGRGCAGGLVNVGQWYLVTFLPQQEYSTPIFLLFGVAFWVVIGGEHLQRCLGCQPGRSKA